MLYTHTHVATYIGLMFIDVHCSGVHLVRIHNVMYIKAYTYISYTQISSAFL